MYNHTLSLKGIQCLYSVGGGNGSYILAHHHCIVHYNDVIMSVMASQITSLTIVYTTVYQRKHQSSASLAFVRGIHRWPVNSPHKVPTTRKMFPLLMMSSWSQHSYIVGNATECDEYSRPNETLDPFSIRSDIWTILLFSMPGFTNRLVEIIVMLVIFFENITIYWHTSVYIYSKHLGGACSGKSSS